MSKHPTFGRIIGRKEARELFPNLFFTEDTYLLTASVLLHFLAFLVSIYIRI